MYLICGNPALRKELVQKLELSDDRQQSHVFSSFSVLPSLGNVAIAVNDLTDGNLRYVIRYFIANAEKKLKFAVIKRRWSDADNDQLDESVRAEFRRAHEENQRFSQKIARLPAGSAWKNDRMEQLRRWQTIPALTYTTFSLEDDLKPIMDSFFNEVVQLAVDDSSDRSVANKPPVLHWTPVPLDMEVQVLLRLQFPLTGPDQSTFVEMCRSIKPYMNTSYEWTDGILLTTEPARLHVERTSQSEIELAARVCVDELEEEQAVAPTKLLWPYVAVALKNILNHLDEHQFLQYSIEIIPYGTSFFDPPHPARVFDLALFMGTACEYGKVAFRDHDQIHNVDLKKLLPDGPFNSLSHLLSLEPPRPKRPQQPNCLSESAVSKNGDIRPNTGLSVSHNRGRRVSFGSIKLMTESNEPVKGVDQYVDDMLKQTMDDLVL
uniref:RGS domain-containing protein n=1 Tax=Haemonchus contortus TaxID=6289 RepID=A0A7I4YIN2_HAECO